MGAVTNGHPSTMEDSNATATTTTPHTGKPASGERASDNSRPNSRPPSQTRQPSTNGTRNHSRHPSTSRTISTSNSVASSREGSPIRPALRRSLNSSSASPSLSRSRRNSEEGNLSRPPSDPAINNQASDTSPHKKLSNVNKPHLPPPTSDSGPTSEPRQSFKSSMNSKSGDSSLQWPVSPRLKSPPPPASAAQNNLPRTSSPKPQEDEAALANTSSKRQPAEHPSPSQDGDGVESEDNSYSHSSNNRNRPSARVLTRGTNAGGPLLSTVEEGGTPITESPKITLGAQEQSTEQPHTQNAATESGSDSGGSNEENKKAASNNNSDDANKQQQQQHLAPPGSQNTGDVAPKRSFTSLNRNKPGEASMKNMIVETETVSSIPQTSLGGGATDRSGASRKDSASSVRMKASDETIRPKKDKKKQSRKAVAIAGNASSKADVFEAKVANAVDDANTSDSEETFVYESNPPDSHANRQHRYHSRTPSATSMGSQVDQYGGRPRLGMRELSHGITGKRSMKFTNTYNTMDDNGDDTNNGRGSVRHARHYHSSRPNRSGAHLSLLDQSPFKSHRHLLGNGNRPNRSLSPRLNHHSSKNGFAKDEEAYDYDFDAEGADDERTPLVSGNRNRQGRRPNSANMRQMEYIEQHRRGWFSRWGVCVMLLVLILALIGCAATFIVGVSKSIADLHVREIQNVLASEQEIMLDLDVEAINPNLFPITMNAMDVKVFAKSRYVGSQSFWRDHGPHPDFPAPRVKESRRRAVMARNIRAPASTDESDNASSRDLNPTDGVDHGTDPIDGDEPSEFPQIMLLGRIFHLYSPLTFEPSPWQHEMSRSVGQVQLTKPGNKTEEGGSVRWENVLQHPFELIVRGVVKYELPLSSRSLSASINSKKRVYPGDDSVGNGNGTHTGDHVDGDITLPDDDDLGSEPSFHTNGS